MTADGDLQRGDFAAALWLFLLKQGGRWQSRDVARGTRECSETVGQMLCAMHRNGSVRQFELPGQARRFAYGVTGDCKVPRQVRVQDLAACLMAQPDDETTT